MKKLLAIVLSALLALSAVPAAMAASFPDLAGSQWDWARPAIDELIGKSVVKGYTDGTYKPDNSVTNEEAFTLFARTVGVDLAANSDAVSKAQSQYASVAARYNTYASKELCYMLYRNIFTQDQLDTYFSADRKGQPILRHEAAVLITKIMGGEDEVQNKYLYVLDYTDADQIPQPSKGYVEYVRDKGIMQGMGDGSFSPMSGVTRAQVAIMLKKTMDTMNLNYISGIVTAVDTAAGTITVNGIPYAVGSGRVTFRVNGRDASLGDIGVGMNAVVTTSGNALWAVDIADSGQPSGDETVTGIYSASLTDTRGTFLKVYDKTLGASSTKEYLVSSNISYTRNGSPARLTDLQQGDAVTLILSDGKVVGVTAEPKTIEITDAVLDEIILTPSVAIKIKNSASAYNNTPIPVNDNVIVKRDGSESDLRSLAPGDKLTLKLEYGIVKSVSAYSTKKNTQGVIEEITIGQASSIKLNVNGSTQQFVITRNTQITLDDKAATIYDLRLGYKVDVKIESDAVTSIYVVSAATPTSVTGVVTLVNASLGFVNLNVTDAMTGEVSTQQVFIRSGASIIDSGSASKRTIKDIKIGDTLMATGAVSTGAFEATAVIILQQ